MVKDIENVFVVKIHLIIKYVNKINLNKNIILLMIRLRLFNVHIDCLNLLLLERNIKILQPIKITKMPLLGIQQNNNKLKLLLK